MEQSFQREEGLGVKNLCNSSRQVELVFSNKREGLWNDVVRGKYGEKRKVKLLCYEGGVWGQVKENKVWHLVCCRLSFVVKIEE